MNFVEILAKATAVLAVAGLVALLLRSRSAAVRHLVWAAAMLAVVLLPLGSMLLPAVPVAALAPVATVITVYGHGQPAASAGAFDWARAIRLLWLAGVLVVSARLLFGLARIAVLTINARPTGLGAGIVRDTRLNRRVRVRISRRLEIPTTWGVFRPVVLLPAEAVEWPVERLHVVLAHELCHVRRLDWLTHLIAHVACAFYWFHPLVWFAASELHRERELACDDGVLTAGIPGSAYAQHLVEIARGISAENTFTVGVAMAQKSYLETRVLAMLDPSLSRGRVTRGLFAMATLAVAFSIVPLAVLRAPAQTTGGGKVSGTVYDASGAAVAKAQVTLKNTTGRNTELTRTNESGAYEISGMPLGTYTLQVAAKGFERYVQPGVVVTAGSASAQNISLQIGKINETVNVTAEGAKPADDRTPPSRIKMGGSVQATKLVHMVRPEYPAVAKAQGIEGSVLLRAVIGKEGQILNLELLNTAVDQSLADAAMESVRQWRYEPTLLNGEPVEVITEITVNFTLAR